ncbi:lipid-A-disaccharide synthase [Halodesulfovibrio sp. MK-HDV]|jgi:lipid-A-disaccharide synthase|uniref:lipid-A-disaccharide synthase n=1 Tax=unclassified Halodesulfovibrio TaxID=2644657 RepID=UPI00136E4C04|nr:lipid-A-disaccharide synthase [Halodesulfovibrio sp. MK-HDV]KAF1073610.1 Lipid-A-disaccharide synthase [Halodesulfovibrio sp. MK-HDV]
MGKNIWINAGETSGDLHGGKLMEAISTIAPDTTFCGMGGQEMRAKGLDAVLRVEDLSVMGITEVLGKLFDIFNMLKKIKNELAIRRPDAVILIDAPEFNFRVAKYAYKLDIPVYYYISPKLWAWRTGRAKFIAKHITRLFSILPFEVEFYKQFDMDIDYIGNPLVDVIDWHSIDHIQPIKNRIGILPGSRKKEIESLMPQFALAASIMAKKNPELEFHCIQAPGISQERLRELWTCSVPLTIHSPENRYEFMRGCTMLIAASGTVTLESALVGTPTLITYQLSKLTFFLGTKLVKVPYVGLPNLIMGREVFPELLQEDANGDVIAQRALAWINTHGKLAAIRRDLETLRTKVGEPGAADRAAKLIIEDLSK